MGRPLTATEMDELRSAMATLDRHGLRIVGCLHVTGIIQVGLCIAALESRLAEVERERDEARDRAAVLDFDREHARLRAIALDEICMAIFGPGEHTVDEVRAAVPALLTRAHRIEEAARGYVEARDAMEHVQLDDFWTRIDAYRAALATLRAALEGGG